MVYVNVSDLPYLVMQSDVYLDSCIADICGDTRRNVTLSELKKLNVIYFWMQGVFMTVVCVVGIITNILNIMTLIRCFKLILYKIFLGMAFADLCHMVSLLIYSTTWGAYTYQLPGFETSFTTVPTSMYNWLHCWYLCMCISNWCSVLLVSFKLFGVMLPLKARIYLNSKRTHIALAAVYISSLAIHSPSWILHFLGRLKEYKIASTVAALASLPAPLTICSLMTVMLLYKLRQQQRTVQEHVTSQIKRRRRKRNQHLTKTLISIVTCYMIANTILSLYFLFYTYGWFIKLNVSHYKEHILYLVCTSISSTSYASNFFVYILANKEFRHSLSFWFKCIGKKSRGKRLFNRVSTSSAGESSMIGLASGSYTESQKAGGKPAVCTRESLEK